MTFRLIKTKGHLLGGDSPRSCTIYMSMMCSICEKYLEDNLDALESIGNQSKIAVICEECAYEIHSAYEGNM